MPLTITSPAFKHGEVIPTRHTRDGDNLSPPLEWRDAPPETKSFVLIVEDPDAPSGTFRHWAMYNIPAGETGLPEGASGQGRSGVGEGVNGFRNTRYDGPQPPKGHGPHHYHSFCRLSFSGQVSSRSSALRAKPWKAWPGGSVSRSASQPTLRPRQRKS
jgi:Raf kinase inhibitor-like YbhB/YbcL family protein